MSEQKQRVYDSLNKLGIKYEVVEHEPVHTMEDMDRLGLPEKGTLCKKENVIFLLPVMKMQK